MKLTPSLLSIDLLNKEIIVYGIVLHVRDLGKKKFILLTDGRTILQVVYEGKEKIKRGDSLKVRGILVEDQRAPNGLELRAKDIIKLSEVKEETFDQWSLRKMHKDKKIKYRPVVLRLPDYMKIFETYAKVVDLLREYAKKQGLLEIFTPKVVRMGTESGSEVFSILYFDKDAYLAQSPQLYKQMLLSSGIIGVYEVGSYYRAEASFTPRHLTEFRGFDIELNYIEDYNEIMDFLEDMIKYVLRNLGIKTEKDFPRLTFEEAKKILEERYKIKIKEDLTTEAEKALGQYAKEEYNTNFIFITEFPYEARPFYTMKKEDNPKYTYSFDLLYKGLEIVSGAKREHRYEILVKQIREKGINPERLKWYLEAFKHGIPPHGGFGLGIDRFVKQILDLPDIRDVVLFPRDPDTLEP